MRDKHTENDIEKQIVIAEKASKYANDYFFDQSTKYVKNMNHDNDYMVKFKKLKEIADKEWKIAKDMEDDYQLGMFKDLFVGLHPEIQIFADKVFTNFYKGDGSKLRELRVAIS